MAAYDIKVQNDQIGDIVLKLSFGERAENDQIVRDAIKCLDELKIEGGKLVKLNGPASLPVAVAIAHHIMHLFS